VAHAAHKARQRRRKNERRHEAVGAILDRLQPPPTTPPTTTTTTTPSAAAATAAAAAETFTPLEQVPAGQPAAGEAAIIDWRSMGAADPASLVGDGDEQAMRGGGGGGEGVLATRRGGGGGGGDEQAMPGAGGAHGGIDGCINGGGGGGVDGGGGGEGGGGGGGSGGDGVSMGAAAAEGEVSLRAMRKRWQVESFALVILELQRDRDCARALDPSVKSSAPAPMHIVDFGAGSGNLTLPLAKRFPDCTFTAVEMKQRRQGLGRAPGQAREEDAASVSGYTRTL
jgi:hypothetical protein